MMRRESIKDALAYVHYWSARERGQAKRTIVQAAKEAVRITGLSPDEETILLNAICVKREEL